jgi:STE24 endopeptidase
MLLHTLGASGPQAKKQGELSRRKPKELWMGRCALIRRFALIVFDCLLLAFICRASSKPRSLDVPPEQVLSVPGSPPTSPAETKSSELPRTEQYTLSHDRYQKAIAYSRAGYTLYFVFYVYGALVLILILRLGVASKYRDMAEAVSGNRWVQGIVFIPLLLLTLDLLDLPLSIYWHALSLHYEQSIQPWGSWISDWAKKELLGTAFWMVVVLILFAVMRRSPRRWWIYFWFPAVLILLGLIVVTPLVFDPIFDKFEPLSERHADLVASIEKLTTHAGVPIPPERMFLMAASRKTKAVNAYVTGLGASKRVVVWDTLIQKASKEETLFIVGHELGHYLLGHVFRGFLCGAAGLFVVLFLLFRSFGWTLDRWATEWRIQGREDWASLVVLLLLLHVLLFFSSPVISGFSRIEEHAADVYGLEVIHGFIPNSEEVAAHAFQVLGELDLADPNPPPFIKFWLYSHPPLAERLVFAHSYDPWSKGEAPKYVK